MTFGRIFNSLSTSPINFQIGRRKAPTVNRPLNRNQKRRGVNRTRTAAPFVNSTIVNKSGRAFEYYVNPKYVPFRYGPSSGFLYTTVSELRIAYDLNSLYAAGNDGNGQTVVIVDAYGSPTIYDDLLRSIGSVLSGVA